MNRPTDYVEASLDKPNPDKPGYLLHDRNLTIAELNDAIQAQLDPRLKAHFEWNGVPAIITLPHIDRDFLPDSPLPAWKAPFPQPDLDIHWRPGGSEGYVVSILANRQGLEPVCVWHAKLFDITATIALHTALMRLLYWHGTGPATELLRIESQLLSHDP